MSGSAKRLWSPNSTIDEVEKTLTAFLTRCQDKRILTNNVINLLHVYRFEQSLPTDNMIEISKFLRFSKNDTPETDKIREALLKLLSAVFKSHYYFDEQAIVRHEPYLFLIPDLFKPGQFRYGVYYPIESNQKSYSLVVSEWDLSFTPSSYTKINPWERFSAIVSPDVKKWFDLKELKSFKDMDRAGYFKINDWSSRKKYQALSNDKSLKDFDLGKVIDYKPELKDYYSAIGLEWANPIKKWFIPKGHDYKLIIEYLTYIQNLDADEKLSKLWLTRIKKG